MKAKELAELLLQNPESNVYIEELKLVDFGDSYYSTEKVEGIEITPDGVFIKSTHVENQYELKRPSTKPKVGTFIIELDTGLKIDYTDLDKYESEYPSASNFNYSVSTGEFHFYHEDEITIIALDDSVKNMYNDDTRYVVYDISSVEKFNILTNFDEEWNCTWKEMTFEEAKEFYKNLGEQTC